LILALLLSPLLLQSQMSRDQFPLNREFKNGFFYLAPGITYTFPADESTEQFQIVDTSYTITSNPQHGNIGYAFEAGWYHSFDQARFFHYIEGGVAYRSFSGSSEIERAVAWDSIRFSETEEVSYRVTQISGLFRAIRANQLGKFTFLTYGPGLNFDYHLSDDREAQITGSESPAQDLKLQLHFQIGIGIRLTENLIFQPQIELPILEGYPTGKWTPSHEFAENYHYPFLFSFRLMFLRKDLMNCNAPTFN